MKFKAFLLDQWLRQHADAEFDLGSSTGPRLTVRELLELAGDSDRAAQLMLDLVLHYPPTAGAPTLREASPKCKALRRRKWPSSREAPRR